MLVVPNNSNINTKHFSSDSRQTNATSLLLKPTGVPVFVSIDQQKQNTKIFSEQSTLESMNEEKLQRTVKAQSFVIGKKIQNQTDLNLFDIENNTGVTDKQFPVKIIYQKQSFSQKQQLHKNGIAGDHQENQENDINKSNGKIMRIDKSKIHLKHDFPKQNAISDMNKVAELKHRPKSATTQQLKKDQVKRTKLGPNNTKIKPQVSYIGKIQLKKRPQTAQKSQERVKHQVKKDEDPISPSQHKTSIPFAHNRFHGQPKNNMTKELLKKAQEKLKEEKHLLEIQKQEQQLKKEKERLLQEEVRKMNQDLIQHQKEKGVERIDFRKKEEEFKEKLRKDENKQERDKRVEMRKKRKEEGRKVLGLDLFDEKQLDEKRQKIKEQQLAQQQLDESSLKKPMLEQQTMFKDKQKRPVSSNPVLFNNKNVVKEMLKEEQKVQEEEELKQVDKKKLLKEQKQKRKQEQREKQQHDEQERLKKYENIKALEDKFKQQKDEYVKKREFQQKVQEEKERLRREMGDQEEKQKKHRKKKSKTENELHKEQIDELKNWIEEEMQKEDAKYQDQQDEEPVIQKEQIRMEPLIKVKIDKKQSNSNDLNQVKLMKHVLPGNHLLAEKEEAKLGPRDNRYGVFGDNGYDKIVEIKRQKYEEKTTTPKSKDEQPMIQQDQNELEELKIINIEKELIKEEPNRKIIIEKVLNKKPTEQSKQRTMKNLEKLFPGVIKLDTELQRQKKEKEQKEGVAIKVIQKWTRGFLGRTQVRKLREKKRSAIEEQYGYFQDQVKFNQEYNLEKFLRDKKKLREKNLLNSMGSDAISENIGAEQSGSNSFKPLQKPNTIQVQNYFKEPSDKDPLSIISIFAKLHAPKFQSSPSQHKHKSVGKASHLVESNSDIVEEIYTENFDEDHKVTSNDEEIEEDSHLLSVPSKQVFNYKPATSSGSINEDIMVSASAERRSKRSPGPADDSSIAEESHLQEASTSKKQESIGYENEAFDSYSGSVAFQRQKQQQQIQGKKELEKLEVKMKESDGQRKELLNEMLEEIKKYEQASVSTVVVERMEKIINMSLHQKDKLVLAARLHELEIEKQHKDEINKIREEQIKLMSQLMLMGGQSQLNEQDKQVLLNQINKIIEKPVTIVSYQQEERVDSIEESLPDNGSNAPDDDDIVEEIPEHSETDNMSKMSEEEIKESVYVDGKKDTNSDLHKMRMTLGSEETIRKQSKKTLNKEGKGQSGLFEKSSFEDFTQQKFKELMLDDTTIREYLLQLEKFEEKEKLKKQELQKHQASPRTYSKKAKELEKWVNEQQRQLHQNKVKAVASYQEMGAYLTKLDSDKKLMVQKIGSPRYNKRLTDSNSQASLDYDDIEEDSNESMRVKQARNQIGQMGYEMSKHQHKDKKVDVKIATAKKLMADKQRAIDEGIKEKMRDIEAEHADQMLNAALELDVNAEIQRRIKDAQNELEDNYDSVRSLRSIDESGRQKKQVKFAGSPSVYSNLESSGPSIKQQPASHRGVTDSIDESIKIEESYKSSKRMTTSQSGIQESIQEEGYSEDFIEESVKASSQREFKPQKSEDRFSSNHKIEDSVESDIDYSMNFDASIGNSQQLPPAQVQQPQKQQQQPMDIVNEESESLSQNRKDEESFQQQSSSHGASQSFQQEEEQSDYDKEIVQSSQSVEWKIQLEKPEPSQRSYRQTDEDKYSEDFEEVEEIDNLEDLESCPDDIEKSNNDLETQIERITNEFMTLVLDQIQDDVSAIKGMEKADVDQFEHKFPFNLDLQPQPVKEEKKQEVINVVVQKQPTKSSEELVKDKFEQQQTQIKETHNAVEQYLDLIIKHIDRKDLINQLERPIENDPLKILARIQAVEYDESASFNNLNESLFGQQQFILSLDQFKLIENLYRAKHSDRASLTESGEQRKLTYENFHHKAVFDAFNDALDYERPYKMKGEPNPWSKQTRQLRPKITNSQAEKILQKGKAKVLAWAKTGAGTKCAPLPPPPPLSNEFDAPSQQPPQISEEERRNQVREEKLGELLTKEIEEGDQLWVDYENEDTQTKFDLADMILQDLANEIAAFLNSKMQ